MPELAWSPEVVVPVSTLCHFVENPREACYRFINGVRSPPTPALVNGQFEHYVRKLETEKLKKIYTTATSDDDLRCSYQALEESVEDAIVWCQREYGFLGLDFDGIGNEVLNRLRIEEDARIAAASNLLKDGIEGYELVTQLLPIEVECVIRSDKLGLVGRIDAIELRGHVRFPVDYKTGRTPDCTVSRASRIQLAAYCLLLGERFGTNCSFGELYFTRYFRRIPVAVTANLKDRVMLIRQQFLTAASEGQFGGDIEEYLEVVDL